MLRDSKFLLDENIPDAVLVWMANRGIDAVSIVQLRMQATPDDEIIPFAEQNGRIIITQDSDFATEIMRHGLRSIGVIFIRPGHVGANLIIFALQKILESGIKPHVPFILVCAIADGKVKVRLRQL